MGSYDAHDPEVLRHYEGLVFKTAQRLDPRVELDFEDIQQVLRIKVWRALLAFDPARKDRDQYVFMCVRDQAKDLLKRRLRGELHIEDLTRAESENGEQDRRDQFDARYLSSSHEATYGAVEDDDVLVPSTLTQLERRVVVLLYRDYKQAEAARLLGLGKREIEKLMRSIRSKMADWAPDPPAAAGTTGQADPRTPIAA